MERRPRLLTALALLEGCVDFRPPDDSILPTQLSLLVEEESGAMLSAVVDLRRNTRHQIDVRVSSGLRLFDGRRLWELDPVQRDGHWNLRVRDLLGRTEHDLPLDAGEPPAVLAMNRDHVWVRRADETIRCVIDRPSCGPTAEAERPPLDHAGPGAGFHLRLLGDEVLLVLPQDSDEEGEPILEGIRRIVGVHWVHEGFIERDPILDRTFRGRATLVANPRPVVLDGELDEWVDAQPLVVDSAWQIEDGAPSWEGPRDGSFSVTASTSAGGVCFAGRVRDDRAEHGDALEIVLGEHRLTVPLDGTRPEAPELRIGAESFGFHFEACLPARLVGRARVPFAAVLNDADGAGAAPTVLATSPLPEGTPSGWVRGP